MSLRKKLARAVLHDGGGLAAVRRWNRRGVRILAYHALAPELLPSLDQQCAHLRRYYHPVSMAEIAASPAGKPLPSNALAVTIDDGYADIAAAQPVFRKHGIQITVYLITDFLDRRNWIWWQPILYAFSHTDRRELEIGFLPEAPPRRFLLESEPQRQYSASMLIEAVKTLPNSRRLAVCEEVLDRLRVRMPSELPSEWRPLSWDQVRQLRREGVEFGAHSKTHPILSMVEDDGLLRHEIAGSKKRIEEELGQAVIHFCYPNGLEADFDRRTVEIVRQCGYETAVTTEMGINFHPDSFLLRRFLVDPHQSLSYFAELVSGVHHLRPRRLLQLP